MSEESTRVLQLLAEGKLTVEQAHQLLEAMGEEQAASFERQSGSSDQRSFRAPGDARKKAPKLKPEQLIKMAMFGVDPTLGREMQRLGYPNLTVDQLTELSMYGVRPEFVRELQGLGLGDLSVDQITKMAMYGVRPEFVRQMRDLGYTELTADQIIEMTMYGVDPGFVCEMHEMPVGVAGELEATEA